ncbi:autotransporter domain-containing protein [Lysobacter pythonis]|uniref:Autotransporter domain-containing protein n=1 Tax=Solilutibacter pythonis TaxID=2483112 RepID=A0A3M2HJ52_9GAMM|nr:autotransporter domain-containing protein [Lysobacter pythonis]RMH89008.1 autotransporter domain-containing protein [Lysobacter pythonis]
MNKVYRVVWNAKAGVWQCVSEFAKCKGKGKNVATTAAATAALPALCFALISPAFSAEVVWSENKNYSDGKVSVVNGGTKLVVNGGSTPTVSVSDGATLKILDKENETDAQPVDLSVGKDRSGKLVLRSRGKISNKDGVLGEQAGGRGEAEVAGEGSHWENMVYLYVGKEGNGSLKIEEKGKVTSFNAYIGNEVGGVGSALVSTGGSWENGGIIFVGVSGEGRLDIESGGKVESNQAFVGQNKEGKGVVTVNGAGSQWVASGTDASDYFVVGDKGKGELNIKDGGKVVASGVFRVGAAKDGAGTVTLNGQNSRLEVGINAHVGNSGKGTVNVQTGGAVSSRWLDMGVNRTGVGEVNIDGKDAAWEIENNLVLARKGKGTVNVLNGGQLASNGAEIAVDKGASGTVIVSGQNSRWANKQKLTVAGSGVATLTIKDGGQFNGGASAVTVGKNKDSIGAVTVTDAGSRWNSDAGKLVIGELGTGKLVVNWGANVQTGDAVIGNGVGGKGSVTIREGDSKWTVRGDALTVGGNGSGSLVIEKGGILETKQLLRGKDSQGSTVRLDNGMLRLSGDQEMLFANFTKANTIELAEGGGIIDAQTFTVALNPEAVISGAGMLRTRSTGQGSLTLAGTQTYTRDTAVETGMLKLAANTSLASSQILVKKGANLVAMRDASVRAVHNQGTLTLSEAGSTLNVNGNFITSDRLNIKVADMNTYGKIAATGNVTLGGTLDVDAKDASGLMENGILKSVITAGGKREGAFKTVSDNSTLFDFVADYSRDKAVDLKLVAAGTGGKPPVEAPKPPVEAPKPPVEAPKPPVEAPKPPVEAPKPPVEAPKPPVEAPKPPVEAPKPPVEAPKPPVEAPKPPVEAPKPPVEAPKPPVAAPKPPTVEPKPVMPRGCATVTACVTAEQNWVALPVASVLDDVVKNQTSGDLARELVSLNGQKSVSKAAEQVLPLFAGAGSRMIADVAQGVTDIVQGRTHRSAGATRIAGAHYLVDPVSQHPDGYGSAWVALNGAREEQRQRDSTPGYEVASDRVVIGADVNIGDTRVGGALAHTRSDAKSRGNSAYQSMKADTWQVLAYSAHALSDTFSIDAQAGFGRANVKGMRDISFARKTAVSDYDASIAQVGGGVSYRIGEAAKSVTPFARVDYARVKAHAYKESGAGALDLSVNSEAFSSLVWRLGVRGEYKVDEKLAFFGHTAVGVESLDKAASVSAAFAGSAGNVFTTQGVNSGRMVGSVGLGAVYRPVQRLEVSARYGADWRKGYTGQDASVTLRMVF